MNTLLSPVQLMARRAVFALDAVQRRRFGVYEFTDDDRCILRVARTQATEHVVLGDGTEVAPGDPILEIHFWNEHIPEMGPDGPDLAWAARFLKRWLHSLRLLARYIQHSPECSQIVAIRGVSSFASHALGKYQHVTGLMGFELHREVPRSRRDEVICFFVSLYVWVIVWVLHPAGLRGKPVATAERGSLWISRRGLLERFGRPERHPAQDRCIPTRVA
ncbi:MAG: YkoP family protein [Chthonomonadales bacterium]